VTLELRGIVKHWAIARTGERVVALESITLDVAAGEFLIFLGPSGCGKSTLLQIIAGLERPTAGEMRATAAARAGNGARKLTSMVFQEYALFPWRTVLENVAFGPEVRKVPRAERDAAARRLIDMVHLTGFEHRYPHELSGGMRQRVSIARALVHDPSLLLMDEPFGALDAMTREFMNVELLRIWRESGKTIVFITHSIPEAVFLADRVVVMSARPGRIQEIVSVDLPRPRDLDVMASDDFGIYARKIRHLFDAKAWLD